MAGHDRRAFSAFELLLALALIGLLLAVLLPSLGSGRSALRRMKCADNLGHVYKAIKARKAEGKDFRRIAPSVWHTKLLPYLSDDNVFICPADEAPTALVENMHVQVRNPRDGFQAKIPLVAGPWVIKLSQTQFNAAKSGGGKRRTAPSYKPDENPRVYWLCIEDWVTKSERDFKDLQIKVTEADDGAVTMEFTMGSTPLVHTLYSGDDNVLRFQEQMKASGQFKVRGDWNSYGLSASAVALRENSRQILCLDYEKQIAKVDDRVWADPVPPFFRHDGHANVLYMDGRVELRNPQQIRPDCPSTAKQQWGQQ